MLLKGGTTLPQNIYLSFREPHPFNAILYRLPLSLTLSSVFHSYQLDTLPAQSQQTVFCSVSLSLGQAKSPREAVDCLNERINQQDVVL